MTADGEHGAVSAAFRRSAAGVADQVVSSASNYLTAFLASVVLAPNEFGRFVLAYAVVTVLLAGGRAFVGESLLAHLPVVDAARRRPLTTSALGTGVLLGLAGSVVCLAGTPTGLPLLAFLPWVPGAMLADAGRYVLLAGRDTARALVVDTVWAIVQLAVLVVPWATGDWSVGVLATAWGVGALAAAAAFVAMTGQWPAGPGAWWAESRYVAGWFTLSSVLGQVQVYAVLLLAGAALSPLDTAGLRAVQLLVYQPAITLMGALVVLLVPVMSRQLATGEPAALRRVRRTALLLFLVVGAVVLVAVPLRDVLLDALFPHYIGFTFLVAPVAVQTALTGLGVPFLAQLRATRRGRVVVGQQLLQLVTGLAAAGTGAAIGGVRGLAWGLVAATGVVLASLAVMAVRTRPAAVAPVIGAAAEVAR